MFLDHFHLSKDPFGAAPDPKFLYPAPGHREALGSLHSAITERRGCAVLVGQTGIGKTTLLRYLREKIRAEADVALLDCPTEDGGELVRAVLESLGIAPEGDSFYGNQRQLKSVIMERQAQGRTVVVMTDEADEFGVDALRLIRFLLNMETAQGQPLQFILAGQGELLARLKGPGLAQLGLYVNSFCHLLPLPVPEVRAYIRHRLWVAGISNELFTAPAASLIASVSAGVPLYVNRLCYDVMSEACRRGCDVIGEDLVWDVLQDLPMPEICTYSPPADGRRNLPGATPQQGINFLEKSNGEGRLYLSGEVDTVPLKDPPGSVPCRRPDLQPSAPQFVVRYQDRFVELAERLLSPQTSEQSYSIGICPVQSADSTSRLAAFFSTCMSQASRSPVLLIEATLRSPCLAQYLHATPMPGLRELVLPAADNWTDCIQPTADPNLFLLSAGSWEDGTPCEDFERRLRLAHALASKHYRSIIIELSGWEDFEAFPAARTCYSLPDAMILAVMPNSCGTSKLRKAVRRLRRADANLVGSILNDV